VDGEEDMSSDVQSLVEELRSIAARLTTAASPGDKPEYTELFARVQAAADDVARSWSGSNLGYHAWVHYASLQPPPQGAHWSTEWGDIPQAFQRGSSGNWYQFDPDDILKEIYSRAGNPDLDDVERLGRQAQTEFDSDKRELKSIIATADSEHRDPVLSDLTKEIDNIMYFDIVNAIKVQLPRGQMISRDLRAISGGWQGAPHQQVFARLNVMRSQFRACTELAALAAATAAHLARREGTQARKPAVTSGRVFLGHGRSAAWRELKDFLEDRLGLQTEEFNRVSPAGVATASRLEEMLESSNIAFLVLTAEDERGDKLAARQNVVHEAGLFQGRLGFRRAIIVREQGCEEFSNIHGLGQLQFPAGSISATFGEVRAVLEREGLGRAH
jgi:predicted nucleotide-binding protein